MSATGLDVFATTVQKTNSWLNDLMQIAGFQDRHKAYLALRAALHALRDRLTVEEVAQFGAQLPMLIRGFYYEGWDPTGKPPKVRDKEQFLARSRKRSETTRASIASRLHVQSSPCWQSVSARERSKM